MGYDATVIGGCTLRCKDEKAKKELMNYMHCELGIRTDESENNPLHILNDASYGRYNEEDYDYVAKLCEGRLDFIGEDNEVWSLVFENGQVTDVPGEIVWCPKKPKVEIPLGDDFTLIAESNPDEDYKEIFVYLKNDKEGLIHQDLAIIAENYTYDSDGNVAPIHGEYSVKVYGDAENEDWTMEHNIGRWSEEYGRWPHEEV